MSQNFASFAFTPSVRKEQEKHNSRCSYARLDMDNQDKFRLTPREISFIEEMNGFYISSVGENGWPYVQFRGGPKGFLKVIDPENLAFADFRGNMQYISTGNFRDNARGVLFLMDYARQARLKIWVETTILEAKENTDLVEKLTKPTYNATVERIFQLKIKAYDWNCPQHITPRYSLEEIGQLVRNEPEFLKMFGLKKAE
jgi:hypothetical protein